MNISKNILKDGGKFVFNFTEFSSKLLKSGELQPHYYFNTRNNSFITFFEKVDLEKGKVYINTYMERIEDQKTKRYIGTSCKNIVKREEIVKYIKEAGMVIINEKEFFSLEGTIKYLILEKL